MLYCDLIHVPELNLEWIRLRTVVAMWLDILSGDFTSIEKRMVIHDTKCPSRPEVLKQHKTYQWGDLDLFHDSLEAKWSNLLLF